jgi:methanogenic corrinoid protein MtbC1
MPSPSLQETGLSIAAVEQATGIARATLRIWERRYGFPQPGRDARDERTYSGQDLEKLRLMAGLMARGHRPGRLVKLNSAELSVLAEAVAVPAEGQSRPNGGREQEEPVLDFLRRHETLALATHLEEEIRSLGLDGFVTRRMPDLNRCVGTGWARGDLQVFEEHLYTEAAQQLLRAELARAPAPDADARPRVLLATFPEESHGLGLLMVQALLAANGCPCTSLGVRVPVAQVLSAAGGLDADVVGLSFSASVNPAHVLRGLEQLRAELPAHVAIWAGGSAPAIHRRKIPGVLPVRHIDEVPGLVAQWRAENAVTA